MNNPIYTHDEAVQVCTGYYDLEFSAEAAIDNNGNIYRG